MTAKMISTAGGIVLGDHGVTPLARIRDGIIAPSGTVRSVIRVRYLLAEEKIN